MELRVTDEKLRDVLQVCRKPVEAGHARRVGSDQRCLGAGAVDVGQLAGPLDGPGRQGHTRNGVAGGVDHLDQHFAGPVEAEVDVGGQGAHLGLGPGAVVLVVVEAGPGLESEDRQDLGVRGDGQGGNAVSVGRGRGGEAGVGEGDLHRGPRDGPAGGVVDVDAGAVGGCVAITRLLVPSLYGDRS
jgi:hypothetical protein